jgi:diacylglycerol kinase (ATP)
VLHILQTISEAWGTIVHVIYDHIAIIFNPKSTGASERKARELARTLRKSIKDVPIACIATKYAGHAEKLAFDIAKKEARPLIVSSSGDGGYNEVVNGVIAAKNTRAICAVLPAGNANDHSRTMQSRPLAESIKKAEVIKLDLLEVAIATGNTRTIRYAHSYVGLGLTPVVAVELNRNSLNSFKEAWIVLRAFFRYRPFRIRHGKKVYKLDSLLFGNINQMAKVLTIAPQNQPADGKFEVIQFPSGRKWWLVKRLAQAAVAKLENVSQASSYEFVTIQKMPMQLDGEVITLHAGCQVTVKCRPNLLATIV